MCLYPRRVRYGFRSTKACSHFRHPDPPEPGLKIARWENPSSRARIVRFSGSVKACSTMLPGCPKDSMMPQENAPTSRLGLMVACAALLACGHGRSGSIEADAAEPDAAEPDGGSTTCGQRRDAGGRSVPYCCGTSNERPGVSCVDLSDSGAYGIYGHCIEQGLSFEGKVLAALCCDGLVIRSATIDNAVTSEPGAPAGCAPDFEHYSPSEVLCLACGNLLCEAHENRCNCPEDCADAGVGDTGQ